jgi:hypothetical protein
MYSGDGGLCTVLVTGAVSSVCRCLTIKTKIVRRTTPTPLFSSCLAYIKKRTTTTTANRMRGVERENGESSRVFLRLETK